MFEWTPGVPWGLDGAVRRALHSGDWSLRWPLVWAGRPTLEPGSTIKAAREAVDSAEVIFRRRAGSGALYRRGIRAWQDRDMVRAVSELEAALEGLAGRVDDHLWIPVRLALAQIALELDDLERARLYLEDEHGTGVIRARQRALRARLHLQEGDPQAAEMAVSSAVEALLVDAHEDPGQLIEGAVALLWCGEVLFEMGYGQEAARIAEIGRRRAEAAGIRQPVLEAALKLVEAGVARLADDVPAAEEILAGVDAGSSPEIALRVELEIARLAWMRGDRAAARARYGKVEADGERLGYLALARMARAEAVAGPAVARSGPGPVEDWASTRRAIEDELTQNSHAVVARLVLDAPFDAYLEAERRIADLLDSRPDLGALDGASTDGHIWELFLEGDDPDALWEAVAPVVAKLAIAGSRVDLRRGDVVQTIPLP